MAGSAVLVDQTCVPEIAVPTLRVPRRGTAWVNRAVHDIALAELAMVPCVPGIHDLQQACSHPQRVAMGEAVSGDLVAGARATCCGSGRATQRHGAQGQAGTVWVRETAFLPDRGQTRARGRSGQVH